MGSTATGEQYLSIDIYDSDYATVDYRPAPGAAGRFYLGIQPRDYWEDPGASEPVDVEAEASGFAGWARMVLGVDLAPTQVRPLIVDAGEGDGEDFVEYAVHQLLGLLGLPAPEGLGFAEDYAPDDSDHVDSPDDLSHPDDSARPDGTDRPIDVDAPEVYVREGAVEVRRAVLARPFGRSKLIVGKQGRLLDGLEALRATGGSSTRQAGEGGEDLAR